MTMICLVWEALNFTLAYRKGQFGPNVVWIGGELTFTKSGVTGQAKQSIVEDIVTALRKFRTENVHSCKELAVLRGQGEPCSGTVGSSTPVSACSLGCTFGSQHRPTEHSVGEAGESRHELAKGFLLRRRLKHTAALFT